MIGAASPREIWAKRSKKAKAAGIGAWDRKQLAQWGVPWPPPKGWKSTLESNWRKGKARQRQALEGHAALDLQCEQVMERDT